jgi:predicted AAA+ superfamily ATPase
MALEGFVAQHLRACAAYRGGEDRLYYWRTKSGSEVQIILYGSNEFVTREIKRAERIRNSDLRALKAFRENYREAHVSVLFLGDDRLETEGIPIIPCVTVQTLLVVPARMPGSRRHGWQIRGRGLNGYARKITHRFRKSSD